jgi:hypothetical protein
MFRLYVGVASQASRSFRTHLTTLTPLKRALSTVVDGESYWGQTPWKDVPAEEFNSYRYQVSSVESRKLSNGTD